MMDERRIKQIRDEVISIYASCEDSCLREWFFEGHVAVVERYCREISQKIGADTELVILSALFHDIARAWKVREDPQLMKETLSKTEEIMKKHGYEMQEIEVVKSIIIPHSCRTDVNGFSTNKPESEEAKILATADALAHLMTDFYFVLPINRWLTAASDFYGWKKWMLEKIERDFNARIFYEEYRELATPRYEAMKTLFS